MIHSTNSNGEDPDGAVGISWYRPDNFEQCLAVFDDASEMHDTYKDWLADAELTEATAKNRGLLVMRINIDPVEFPKWCEREGFAEINNQARSFFVSKEVERIMKRRQRKNK